MSTPCRELALSLGRPREQLSAPERLRLEQHLSTCADCRRSDGLSQLVTSMVLQAETKLDERARERALQAAFVSKLQPVVTPTRTLPLRLALLVAAAALLALGVRAALVPKTELARSTPVQTPAASVAPAQLAAAPDDDAWLEVASEQTRAYAHAQVVLSAGTRVRFHDADSTLELSRGHVDVDVDPSRHAPFAVLTEHFRVQVMGTQFSVTPERVVVQHGHVLVLDAAGAQLADLHAAEVYTHAEPRPTRAAPAHRDDASSWLERARLSLSRGDVATARGLVQRAKRVAVRRGDRAEAGTLEAECAVVAREPARAIEAYLEVARQYDELPAGENALFAAAQLGLRKGDRAQGRRLLSRYLQRYPGGRFADEARSRLAESTP